MSITMTESAAEALKKHKEAVQAPADLFLRVKIVAGGCSGFEHRLTLDNTYDETKDTRLEFHGENLVVDKKSELYLEGATLNYINGLEQQGFHLDLPSAKKTCGCGHSYQF